MADSDPRHIDRAAEEARQQAIRDAVAALDLSQVGREPAPAAELKPEAPLRRRLRRSK